MGLSLLSNYLYYSAFSLAWFLVGFISRQYVFIYTKQLDAGIIRLKTLVGMGDGMDITADSNSHFQPGGQRVVWDFPRIPAKVSKFIEHS